MPANSPENPTSNTHRRVGAVAIGRNEGTRLERCLDSLATIMPRVVYVDSGSTDGSVSAAEQRGATVVNLDTSTGFTAARARNAGCEKLLELYPDLEFVQFLDGDCELDANWIATAQATLDAQPQLGVVCGRRRERYPEQTIYNRICDMEWNTPIGRARSCGGDALMRVQAWVKVGGYNPHLIAGEEPELCVRLRQDGWFIERIDAEMTLHDAAMTRLWQWAKRAERAGHAYAEGAAMHGAPPERHCVRESRRIWVWAIVWPLIVLLTAVLLSPWTLLGLLIYPLQIWRTARWRRRAAGDTWAQCLLYGLSCIAANWPQCWGQISYWRNRWRGRRSELIEYKK
ncbi:MAG: glycosyltransferase family 2 protein [Planctomycetales bacterium]|nr:glycosyltransferase family 2 protein [Planctomycetales bacterium]